MIHYIVASHGALASGFKSALGVLLGNVENVDFIDCYVDDRNPKELIKNVVEALDDDTTLVMFSDLYGGSVCQIMNEFMERPNTYQVAGVNLSMLIELLAQNKDDISLEELKACVGSMKDSLQCVILDDTNDDETDFF